MKKVFCLRFIFMIVLMTIISCNFNLASAAGVQLTDKNELYISNLGILQLGNKASVNEATTVLGKIYDCRFVKNDAAYFANATLQHGEIWIDQSENKNTSGPIGRVLSTKPGIHTSRGIGLGDSKQKIVNLYGNPGFIMDVSEKSKYVVAVDQWYMYFYKDRLSRLIFGLDYNGNVYCIGYSNYAGGI